MALLPIFAGAMLIALLLSLSIGVLAWLFPYASLDPHEKNR